VFVVVVYFIINSLWKLFDTPSYLYKPNKNVLCTVYQIYVHYVQIFLLLYNIHYYCTSDRKTLVCKIIESVIFKTKQSVTDVYNIQLIR